MRTAGRVASRALALAGSLAMPGATTDSIDRAVHRWGRGGGVEGDVWPAKRYGCVVWCVWCSGREWWACGMVGVVCICEGGGEWACGVGGRSVVVRVGGCVQGLSC